jgi:Flp pilus assembly pilin Flp
MHWVNVAKLPGVSSIEYAFIASLVSVFIVAALIAVGEPLPNSFNTVAQALR